MKSKIMEERKMKDEKRQDIALFRYGILAPLISGTLEENMSNKEFYSSAAKKSIPILMALK